MRHWEKKSTVIKRANTFFVRIFCFVLIVSSLYGCAFRRISRYKNISYRNADHNKHVDGQELNVFTPHKPKSLKNVLVFIHGGNWNSGKKSLYNFFGSRMARKNVVMVVIDYPLSPAADYNDMAVASAQALKWVGLNIEKYGGDPDKIFISGHSAGGHLAALITLQREYFDSLKIANPIKGLILIDAAGLDMYTFLKEEKSPSQSYFKTFTKSPEVWKKASPINYLHDGMPPMLIYRGEKTYPSIIRGTEEFVRHSNNYKVDVNFLVLKRKKHVPMITQFFWPYNPRYKQIITFMKTAERPLRVTNKPDGV